MKRRSKRVLLGLVIVLAAAALAVYLSLGFIVRKGIEAGGTAMLGVPTRVTHVSVSLPTSTVTLSGLQVANPEGYRTDRLFLLGAGKVSCNILSLLKNEVVVREIELRAPELTIEYKGLKSNVDELMARLRSMKATAGSQKKFRIGLIRITDAKARFILLDGSTIIVSLPPIELKDIGTGDKPVLIQEVSQRVLGAIVLAAVRSGKGRVPGDLLGRLGLSVEFLGGAAVEGLKGLLDRLK